LNARAIIEEASERGVILAMNGADVTFKSTAKPAPDLLAKLRENKAAIAEELRQGNRPEPEPESAPTPRKIETSADWRARLERQLEEEQKTAPPASLYENLPLATSITEADRRFRSWEKALPRGDSRTPAPF
jgi:predicted Zn-dependent protease